MGEVEGEQSWWWDDISISIMIENGRSKREKQLSQHQAGSEAHWLLCNMRKDEKGGTMEKHKKKKRHLPQH